MIDKFMESLVASVPHNFLGYVILVGIIVVSLIILSKGADLLVDEAVLLSERWGVPKMIIGATIVSLGTTLPEVTVSVVSSLKGAPGLAMGNAVGSIICDTGLILGVSALIKPLPFKKEVINKQGWIQLGAAVLLAVTAFVFGKGFKSFSKGGHIPQFMGIVFIIILIIYVVITIKDGASSLSDEVSVNIESEQKENTFLILIKLLIGIVLVVVSSEMLIPAVQEFAVRVHIPETVIAATLVAFGTSLPELVTGITSARKGHGDLAIGNVMGADILNVLLVVGASASVTKGGLFVEPKFFYLLFPAMLFVIFVFKGSVLFSKEHLKRPVGFVLLGTYLLVTILSYFI